MSLISESRKLVDQAWQSPGTWDANYAAAEALLRQALARTPDDPLTLTCLGAVLSDVGKHGEAASLLRRAVELGSTDRNTFYNLGVALVNRGALKRGRSLLLKAAEMTASPESWSAWFDPHGH